MAILIDVIAAFVMWVLQIVGTLVVYAFRGLIYLSKVCAIVIVPRLVLFLAKARHIAFSKKEAVKLDIAPMPQAKVEVPQVTPTVISEPKDVTTILTSSVQIVPIDSVGNMTVKLRFDKELAERSVLIANAELAQKFETNKLVLADLKVSSTLTRTEMIAFAYKQSLLDLESMLNAKLASRSIKHLEKSDTIKVDSTPVVEKSIEVVATPKLESAKVIAEPALMEEKREPEMATQNDPDDSAKPQTLGFHKHQKVREYHGRFLGIGRAKRVGETFFQYFVEFHDDSLNGAINRVWGNGLKNAISIVQPKSGDRICITNHGYDDVLLPSSNKLVKRQAYIITKTK